MHDVMLETIMIIKSKFSSPQVNSWGGGGGGGLKFMSFLRINIYKSLKGGITLNWNKCTKYRKI